MSSKHFKFRWPDSERKAAEAKAKRDGFKSLSAYIRYCINHCRSFCFARGANQKGAK